MIHYHDHSRPAPSKERARCGREIPGHPGYRCAELLDIATNGHGRHVEACPACDWGHRRTRAVAVPVPKAVEMPDRNLKGRTFAEQSELCRKGWEKRRARAEAENARLRGEIRTWLRAFYRAHGRGPTYAEMGHEGQTGPVSGGITAAIIRRAFGSVGAAFQDADIPRNPRGDSRALGLERRDRGRGMVMRRLAP